MLLGRYDKECDNRDYDEKAPGEVGAAAQGMTLAHAASPAAAAEPPSKRPLTSANLAATSRNDSNGATAQVFKQKARAAAFLF